MSQFTDHTTLWAEKLQQVELPESSASWQAMESVLNREMPQPKSIHWNRWILLAILLLLLIGVCYCPGARNSVSKNKPSATRGESTGSENSVAANSATTEHDKKTAHVSTKNVLKDENNSGNRNPDSQKTQTDDRISADEPVTDSLHTNVPRVAEHQVFLPQRDLTGSKKNKKPKEVSRKFSVKNRLVNPVTFSKQKQYRRIHELSSTGQYPQTVSTENHQEPSMLISDTVMVSKDSSTISTITSPVRTQPQSVKKNRTDSSAGKIVREKKQHWWEAGAGFNQFFILGSQVKSDYNSSGTSGNWKDYLPVPVIRYHLNEKFFIQLEAQFNAPQYTKNLLAEKTISDTIQPGLRKENSVFIRKLFYFNLPLSVHYRIFSHVFLGTGIQYSRLTNAVGFLEDKQLFSGRPDSILLAKTRSLKGDSVYRSLTTQEFRFLADLSYQWKGITLGARYNQALSNFIHVQISGNEITQARNSSFQLYLRYCFPLTKKKESALAK